MGDFGELTTATSVQKIVMGTGWQKIETAPKDGREILIATKSYYTGVVAVHWYQPRGADRGVFADWDGDAYNDATHWMPLPPPPSEGEMK